MDKTKLDQISAKLHQINDFINTQYYEVEDYSLCILLSMISRTNMIALGQPGIAKSAVLRTFVDAIDFEDLEGTPYFHIQMGSDVSPNNVFGAPDIEYFKRHGIIKRHYKGFLPDAVIAFCSEFYRVNDQVANSGLLTILNEGEFKNGVDTVKTKLRFFMADTNFFPKQKDDLDVEETDLKLQALHDRFLSRVMVKPLVDHANKMKMILMDDKQETDVTISINDIIYMQDHLHTIDIGDEIARLMIDISEELETKHDIFISPRRLKLSRNLVRAHAVYSKRNYCLVDDLVALQYSFWQKEDDLNIVHDLINEKMDLPNINAEKYSSLLQSIQEELDRNINNHSDFFNNDTDTLYEQALSNIMILLERVQSEYPQMNKYKVILDSYNQIELTYKRLTKERNALN